MSGASRIFSGAEAICLPGKKGSLVYYLNSDILIGRMQFACQVKRELVYSLSSDILIGGMQWDAICLPSKKAVSKFSKL
jgi:hypothetical protein